MRHEERRERGDEYLFPFCQQDRVSGTSSGQLSADFPNLRVADCWPEVTFTFFWGVILFVLHNSLKGSLLFDPINSLKAYS